MLSKIFTVHSKCDFRQAVMSTFYMFLAEMLIVER